MNGRTENNIKNRFNMLLKNMKDDALRNTGHNSIKDANKLGKINDEVLIQEMIIQKKRQLE